MPKYPHVKVRLGDGNAYAVIGTVSAALRRGGVSKEEIDAFQKEATSGDYDHLLQTVIATVNLE